MKKFVKLFEHATLGQILIVQDQSDPAITTSIASVEELGIVSNKVTVKDFEMCDKWFDSIDEETAITMATTLFEEASRFMED